MEKLKDLKLISLFIILILFTLFYFVSVNKVSYAFDTNYDFQKIHDQKLEVIKACAVKYGENNKELFSKEDSIYIKVSDLISANLIAPDESGNIIDLSTGKKLNEVVVKISHQNDEYTAEVSV